MARTKEFDRDAALDRAMHVFWKKGYEATSLPDLLQAMGIARQSLYDTFGEKHALFMAALERYTQLILTTFAQTIGVNEGARAVDPHAGNVSVSVAAP